MSDEKNQNLEKQAGAGVKANTAEKEETIPYWRFKEVVDQRKQVEKRLEALEKAEQDKKDEDLTFKEKFEKKERELNNLIKQTKLDSLRSKASSMLMDKGFPRKIIDPVIRSTELTEDTLDTVIKRVEKEYEEFLPKKEKPAVMYPTNDTLNKEQKTIKPTGFRAVAEQLSKGSN